MTSTAPRLAAALLFAAGLVAGAIGLSFANLAAGQLAFAPASRFLLEHGGAEILAATLAGVVGVIAWRFLQAAGR